MKTVFLTGDIHSDAAQLLKQHAAVVIAPDSTAQAFIDGVANADAVVVRHPLPPGIFNHAPRLRCAVRHGAGVDMIPVDEASRSGILVANVPGVNAEFVAEFAMGQMLNLSRRLVHVGDAFRQHSWERGKEIAYGGTQLKGKTVGIIGFGAIGKALASMCRNGFAMNVVAAKRRGQNYSEQADVKRLELDELLSVSDFVVLSCPLTAQTEGLIDKPELSKMKRSAYLINVARGRVINTNALLESLKNQDISGAALDVYEATPLPPGSALFDFNEVLLTPHVAAMTEDSMRIMAWEAAVQVLDALQGKYPKNWVNVDAESQIGARWKLLDEFR